MRKHLLAWQWQAYSDNHAARANLLLHLVTVPLFIAGLAVLVAGALAGRWWLLPAGFAGMLVALAAQGRGHRGEPVAPTPFHGPGDFVSRLFAEQLVSFPRFVASGGWARAWRAAGARRAS